MIVAAGILLIATQTFPAPDLTDDEIAAVATRLAAPRAIRVFEPPLVPIPPARVAQNSAPTPSLYDYIYCVSDAAERLDPSGEPVTVVVDAAGSECRHLQRGPAAAGSVLANLPDAKYQELMGEFRAMVASNVSRRLVGLRACRNTRECDVLSVPPAFNDLPPRGQ